MSAHAGVEVALEDCVERVGFGRFQLPVLLAAGLTWSGDAMEITALAFVLPVLQSEWNISQAAADAFASVVFAGMLAGALAWGLLTDSLGRRTGWFASTALTAVAGALSSLVPDGAVTLFLLVRAAVGLGLAGTNIGFALCSELLPRRTRGTSLMLFECFFVAGSVFEVLLAWLVLGRAGWRWVLLLSTLPLWSALALARLVPESPRWLTAHGRTDDASATLSSGARANGRPEPLGVGEVLLAEGGTFACITPPGGQLGQLSHGAPVVRLDERTAWRRCLVRTARAAKFASSQVAMLFFPSMRAISISLCCGWFSLTCVYFGCIFLTPKLLANTMPFPDANVTARESTSAAGSSDASYVASLLATLAEVPGLLLATASVDRAGRVNTVVGGAAVVAAALAAMAVVVTMLGERGEIAVVLVGLIAIARAAAFGAYSALLVLSAELLPTSLRATGFGMVSAASRLAGTVTPFIAGSVWEASASTALVCYAAMALLCASAIGRLGDTANRAMVEHVAIG